MKFIGCILSILIVLLCGCSSEKKSGAESSDSALFPAEMRKHMEFTDFVEHKKTGPVHVLCFDNNKDSKADTWEHWMLDREPPLQMAKVDKNFDGSVDTWIYFDPQRSCVQERDTNGDGQVDRWLYRDGKKGYDKDGNGKPDKFDYVKGSIAEQEAQKGRGEASSD